MRTCVRAHNAHVRARVMNSSAVDETATRGVESGGGRLFALHCRVDGAIACQPWTTMRMVEQYDDVTSRQWHMAYMAAAACVASPPPSLCVEETMRTKAEDRNLQPKNGSK